MGPNNFFCPKGPKYIGPGLDMTGSPSLVYLYREKEIRRMHGEDSSRTPAPRLEKLIN